MIIYKSKLPELVFRYVPTDYQKSKITCSDDAYKVFKQIWNKDTKAIIASERKYDNEAYSMIDSMNRQSNRFESFIGGAFVWAETSEGQNFWNKYYELARKENNEDMQSR